MVDKIDSGAILKVGFNTPFAEQLDFFRRKLNLPTEHWDDIMRSAHDRAFVVAGAMKADLLDDLQQAVFSRMADGKGLEAFRKDFRAIVGKHGWQGWTGEGSPGGFAWRTKVIYQTNMATSYAAGRYRQLTDPEFVALRPYWRYKHADGVMNPRLQHVAWNGLTLPHDHPFWKTHFPPNGWGCHCRVTPVSAREYAKSEAAGLAEPPDGWDDIDEKTGAPVGVAKGFDYAPGASVVDEMRALVKGKVEALPSPLGDALSKEVLLPKQSALRNANSEVLSRASADAPGIEYAALVGSSGDLLWVKRGQKSSVSFEAAEVEQMPGGVLTHNHPKSRSLSIQDLNLLNNAKLHRVYALGSDGSIFAASARNGVSNHRLGVASEIAQKEVVSAFMAKISAGEIGIKDAERYHQHAVNTLLNSRGFIRYHAMVTGGVPPWVYDVIRTLSK